MILALETSTHVCSVAFMNNEGKVDERRTNQKGSHSELLFQFIADLKRKHDFEIDQLDAVIVSEGPGSYTGLRISASAVKGLLFKQEIELFGVNSLAGFARSALQAEEEVDTIHAVIDARRKHLYYQRFECDDKKLQKRTDITIIPIIEAETLLGKGDVVIGTGMNRLHQRALDDVTVLDHSYISAKSLILIHLDDNNRHFLRKVAPENFEPTYYTSRQVEE